MAIGARIKQARKMARRTLRDLAQEVGVSPQAISNYERGVDVPRPSVLLRLARALDVRTEFFLRNTEVRLECPRYRKKSRFGVADQEAIEEQTRERLERYLEVESLFPVERFGAVRLTPQDRKPIATVEEAEDVAAELRRRWDLGTDAIENLAEVLEDHGVKVLLIDAPEGFDGLACWGNGEIPVIVANATKPWDRQRFDLAHELGELILEPTGDTDQELAAHRFAGAFLVSREAALRELGCTRAMLDLEELRLLKQEYGISMQAWVRRARDLGIITQATYTTLCRRFSALGLRRDEQTEPRQPDRARRFELLVHQAEAENWITSVRAAELLGRTPQPSRRSVTDEELRAAAEAARSYYESSTDEQELAAFVGELVEEDE